MNRARLISLVCGLTVAMTSATSLAAGLEAGKPFPRLVFPDLDGQAGSIAQFQGQKTILHIFASW